MEELKEHEGIITTVLEHEITKLIAIVAAIFTIVNYIIIPLKLQGQELESIKNNHLHAIEQKLTELSAIQDKEETNNSVAHNRIMEELTKTATMLDQHLKTTP